MAFGLQFLSATSCPGVFVARKKIATKPQKHKVSQSKKYCKATFN
jgi:hypothetical protein